MIHSCDSECELISNKKLFLIEKKERQSRYSYSWKYLSQKLKPTKLAVN